MQQDIIIGLDISKDKIDCHIETSNNQSHIIISNDPQGYETLLAYLQPADYPYIKACCEATNTYWQGIAHYLHNHAITISVVNPASIKAYGKLKLKRIKTDKQDAKLIADYCRQYQPQAWQPSSPKQTAQVLLAVTGDLHKYPTAKHLISWLGLSPVMRQSGKSQCTARMSKMGDKSLRKALYMPARAACLNSKLWRGWFDYQVRRGKAPKQIYVMMMCKLVRYAYVCLKNNQPFDAAKHIERLETLNNA